MRLPRDMSGAELAKRLTVLGYAVTRQTGSHMRLTTTRNGEHHITIPAHTSTISPHASNLQTGSKPSSFARTGQAPQFHKHAPNNPLGAPEWGVTTLSSYIHRGRF